MILYVITYFFFCAPIVKTVAFIACKKIQQSRIFLFVFHWKFDCKHQLCIKLAWIEFWMLSHLWNNFLSLISMEKRIKKFWIAGFFIPAINATVFSTFKVKWWNCCCKKLFFINEISSPLLLLGALFEHILCGESTHEKVAFSFGWPRGIHKHIWT